MGGLRLRGLRCWVVASVRRRGVRFGDEYGLADGCTGVGVD